MNSNCGTSNAFHPRFHGRASDVTNPVAHGALDFFETVSVDKLWRISGPRSVSTSWLPWPTTRFCRYVRQQKFDWLEQNHTWLGMRNLWFRWKNPCRGIYPSLFYQQHAPQSFFTCWSFSKRDTDINKQQCLPPLGLYWDGNDHRLGLQNNLGWNSRLSIPRRQKHSWRSQ